MDIFTNKNEALCHWMSCRERGEEQIRSIVLASPVSGAGRTLIPWGGKNRSKKENHCWKVFLEISSELRLVLPSNFYFNNENNYLCSAVVLKDNLHLLVHYHLTVMSTAQVRFLISQACSCQNDMRFGACAIPVFWESLSAGLPQPSSVGFTYWLRRYFRHPGIRPNICSIPL
jgi:hypothetical protein